MQYNLWKGTVVFAIRPAWFCLSCFFTQRVTVKIVFRTKSLAGIARDTLIREGFMSEIGQKKGPSSFVFCA
jgi:hypothetical protein